MLDMISHNKLVVAVLALLVAGGAWYVLGGSGGGQEEVLVTENFATPASQADKDLVTTLLQLRSVTLDGTIFSDPVFKSLKDFGSEIVPEPVGRENPFAPLPGRGATAAKPTTPTTPAPPAR